VKVQQPDGNPLIERDRPVHLHITLENLKVTDDDLNVGIHLLTDEEVLVFGSNLRENSDSPPTFPVGMLDYVVEIPASLLNAGEYRVNVLVMRHSKPMLRVEDAVAFTVQEAQRTGAYFGKRPGVVRPALRWWRA